jgi:hypothetical protein
MKVTIAHANQEHEGEEIGCYLATTYATIGDESDISVRWGGKSILLVSFYSRRIASP